jgi:hypothetical protein
MFFKRVKMWTMQQTRSTVSLRSFWLHWQKKSGLFTIAYALTTPHNFINTVQQNFWITPNPYCITFPLKIICCNDLMYNTQKHLNFSSVMLPVIFLWEKYDRLSPATSQFLGIWCLIHIAHKRFWRKEFSLMKYVHTILWSI